MEEITKMTTNRMIRGSKNSKSLEFVDYNGERFYIQYSGRYYSARSGKIRLLHRRVWSDVNGEIREGHHVHHIDGNWRNNDISNLELVDAKKHQAHHLRERMENNPEVFAESRKLAWAAATVWHRSDEGRDWHKGHGVRVWESREPTKATCSVCSTEYETFFSSRSRFCSRSCSQKESFQRHKTATGVCAECGSEFSFNRYRTQTCCSRVCSNRRRGRAQRIAKLTA